MSDVVVQLGLRVASDEARLADAIEAFARWRETLCGQPGIDPPETPDVMVRTVGCVDGRLEKQLTFPNRDCAAAFLRFWRSTRQTGIPAEA